MSEIVGRPAIFHLSFPVTSVETSVAFYQGCLGASVGRVQADWVDIILFGHQLTLHNQPHQVLPREARGVRHFGIILDWADWETARKQVVACGRGVEAGIQHRLQGKPGEHVKLLLEDPDGNLIEIKSYRSIETVVSK